MIDVLVIGSSIEFTPVSVVEGETWLATSAAVPEGWTCNLVHRVSDDVIPGKPLVGWVLGFDRSTMLIEVSDSDFGFLSISDRMRPRYVRALAQVANLLAKERAPQQGDADFVSEVKGMFNRCVRRDQWDWCAVFHALQEPSFSTSRKLAGALGEVSRALRADQVDIGRHFLQASLTQASWYND